MCPTRLIRLKRACRLPHRIAEVKAELMTSRSRYCSSYTLLWNQEISQGPHTAMRTARLIWPGWVCRLPHRIAEVKAELMTSRSRCISF
jgi:hypothetical protein